MSANAAAARASAKRPRVDPLEHEALLLRHQAALELLKHPDLAGVPDLASTEERVSLLAAVVCPPPALLEWSIERARAKLIRRLNDPGL